MLTGVCAVALVACTASTPAPRASSLVSSSNPFRTGRTLVIPHNGGDGDYPADTMLAYEHSMAAGGEVVDIDVSLTADGQLVAFHDASVDAITGGHGDLATMTLAELEALDAGWGYTRADGSHPYRAVGIKIPLIRDILARFPTAFVSLDLKDLGTDIVAPVCQLLRATERAAKTFVGSDGDAQIIAMRQQCPDVHTTFDLADVKAMRAAMAVNDAAYSAPAVADQPPYRIGTNGTVTVTVTAASLAFAHAHDIAVLPWVVDDEATMRLLVDLGVDGIYTRHPALLATIVRHHQSAATG